MSKIILKASNNIVATPASGETVLFNLSDTLFIRKDNGNIASLTKSILGLPPLYIEGLEINTTNLDQDATTASNSFIVSSGRCRGEGDDVDINLSADYTVDITNLGLSASTPYYVFAISDGAEAFDVQMSTSLDPTLPSGYYFRRRIGAITTADTGTTMYKQVTPKGQQHYRKIYFNVELNTTATNPFIFYNGQADLPDTFTLDFTDIYPLSADSVFLMYHGDINNDSFIAVESNANDDETVWDTTYLFWASTVPEGVSFYATEIPFLTDKGTLDMSATVSRVEDADLWTYGYTDNLLYGIF